MKKVSFWLLAIGLGTGIALAVAGGWLYAQRHAPLGAISFVPSAAEPAAPPVPKNELVLGNPKPVAKITFASEDGRELTLDDFRGRVVLLNIWATWCTPCRKEMPALDRLQAELGGPGFEVVALSIDRGGIPAIRAFYDEIFIENLAIYADSSGRVGRALGAAGIPTTLLLNRKGLEIARVVGPAEWDSAQTMFTIRRVIERGMPDDES